MALHHISSAANLKAIKPGDARRRISDGGGLYLPLFVKGASHGWRFDYAFGLRQMPWDGGRHEPDSIGAHERARPVRLSQGSADAADLAQDHPH